MALQVAATTRGALHTNQIRLRKDSMSNSNSNTKQTVLGRIISGTAEVNDLALKDLTVLSPSRDPYRLDTPANHRDAQWLLDCYNEVHTGGRIHLRGLHYKLVGRVTKPDGTPYVNDDKTWKWMSEKVAKAARFLGYIPWTALRDARNSPPRIFTPEHTEPFWALDIGRVEVKLPDMLEPQFQLYGNLYRQPYRQIVIAEKQGVEELLLPICERRQATLCLPGGELSDQMLYDMLADAETDGRPLAIHQLGDFDPAGWQMAVSTGRTVQALVDSQFPCLDVRVHAIGLTLEQCEEWDLPSSPLKSTELRADNWMAAQGREQTELDAAVALAPDEFARTVENSLLQYFDTTVEDTAFQMCCDLEDEESERLADELGDDVMERIRSEAEARLDELSGLVDEINESLHVDPGEFGIERPVTPDVLIGEVDEQEEPLIDTSDGWGNATVALKRRKAYV